MTKPKFYGGVFFGINNVNFKSNWLELIKIQHLSFISEYIFSYLHLMNIQYLVSGIF